MVAVDDHSLFAYVNGIMHLETRRLFGDAVEIKSFIRLAAMARRTRRKFVPVVGMLLLLAAIFAAGCSSLDKPASVSFTSVIVNRTYSVGQIQQAAMKVFQQNGYQGASQPDGSMMFEREATRGEQISYAGIVGAQNGEKVVIQVRVKIEARDANTCWLGCRAYAVCNPDQPIYSSTTAMFNFQSGPYQKLLDKVKGTLQQPAVIP
jgi:hypothetical protein